MDLRDDTVRCTATMLDLMVDKVLAQPDQRQQAVREMAEILFTVLSEGTRSAVVDALRATGRLQDH